MKTENILYLILGFLIFFTLPFFWAIYLYAIPVILIVLALRYLFKGEKVSYANVNERFTTEGNRLKDFLYRCKTGISVKEYVKPLIMVSLIFVFTVFLIYFLLINTLRKHHTKQKLNEIKIALDQYKSKNNGYPQNLTELTGRDPLMHGWLTDNWGNAVVYTKSPTGYTLLSSGKDEVPNTNDDIIIRK